MTHDITAGLQAYITREIREAERRTLEVAMEVVGEVLAEERRKLRTEFEAEITKLRIEFLREQARSGTRREAATQAGADQGALIA